MEDISIDLAYKPYPHQSLFHQKSALVRNALLICARQHGKSELAIFELLTRALNDTDCASYAVIQPFLAQARRNFWPRLKQAIDPFVQYCKVREGDMVIKLPNGTTIHCLGADNESARGLSLRGLIVDEFDNIDSRIWRDVFIPTQTSYREKAWTIYIGTLARGNSKLWALYEQHRDDPEWHCQISKASECVDNTGQPLVDEKAKQRFLVAMGESSYLREFECDPNAPSEHSVLGDLLTGAKLAKRIVDFPINPTSEVHTAWDLGFRDYTAIWLFQLVGNFVHVIGFHEFSGIGLPTIINRLRNEHPDYGWGNCLLPHDVKQHDLSTGISRLETFYDAHVGQPVVLPRFNIADTLHAARLTVPRCYFHSVNCQKGLIRLAAAEYQVNNSDTVLDKIIHDENSHAFDAFRYLGAWMEQNYPTNAGDLVSQQNRVFTHKVKRTDTVFSGTNSSKPMTQSIPVEGGNSVSINFRSTLNR